MRKNDNYENLKDGDTPQSDIDDLYVLLREIKYSHVSLLQAIYTNYRRTTTPVQHDPTDLLCITEQIMLTKKGYDGKTSILV